MRSWCLWRGICPKGLRLAVSGRNADHRYCRCDDRGAVVRADAGGRASAIVTTSNRVPDDLYKDGLNRNLFLPFIALLKERLDVVELTSPRDYRQDRLEGEKVYFEPHNAAAVAAIDAIWNDLSRGQGAPLILRVKSRDVELPAFAGGVARARFYDLCGQALGPADYLAIAEAVSGSDP